MGRRNIEEVLESAFPGVIDVANLYCTIKTPSTRVPKGMSKGRELDYILFTKTVGCWQPSDQLEEQTENDLDPDGLIRERW